MSLPAPLFSLPLRFPLRFTPSQGKYPMAGISLKDFCRPAIRPLRQRPRRGGENPFSRTSKKKGGSKEKQKSPYSSLALPSLLFFFVGKSSFVATRQSGWERFFLEFSPSTVSEKRQVGRLGVAPLSLPSFLLPRSNPPLGPSSPRRWERLTVTRDGHALETSL